MYPVVLSLAGRSCLVVGGGGVALRKVTALVAEGALVTVVAPVVVRALAALGRTGSIRVEERPYAGGDVRGRALVFAATDDRATNARVVADAQASGVFVNVADDPELCSFQLPARLERGALQLAVGSGGGAPFVVRRLRQMLERRFGREWSEWMEAAVRFRAAVRRLGLPRAEAERRYDRFFAATVDPERLRARVPATGELEALAGADAAGRPAPVEASPRPTVVKLPVAGAGPGLVSLVGAGPGDAGLLTVRGWERLLAADAVVYDRLAAGALPPELPARVELRCVGKEAGHHPVPQDEICELLVRLGRAGKRVVRLKGGDPYVFGRGGEEAEALSAAGVPWETVPGVTSGIAAAACAGIPVTHRGAAVRLTLVTAHESSKAGGPQVRWDLLAQDPHATLVGYMGVASLADVARKLVAAGMSPTTPAAVVEHGTTSAQRSVVSTLAGLHAAATRAGIGPPALFVIGPTVKMADTLDFAARRPLAGERVGMFAPDGELCAVLERAGAEVVKTPLVMTPAARVVIAARPLTAWVLRSAEDADLLEEERDSPGWGAELTLWCLEPEAADRARRLGHARVRLATPNPAALAAAMAEARAGHARSKEG